MQWGARLYQPRSILGLSYFEKSEQLHLNGELFGFANAGLSLVAIGLYYQQLPGDSAPHFYYRFLFKGWRFDLAYLIVIQDKIVNCFFCFQNYNDPSSEPHFHCRFLLKVGNLTLQINSSSQDNSPSYISFLILK